MCVNVDHHRAAAASRAHCGVRMRRQRVRLDCGRLERVRHERIDRQQIERRLTACRWPGEQVGQQLVRGVDALFGRASALSVARAIAENCVDTCASRGGGCGDRLRSQRAKRHARAPSAARTSSGARRQRVAESRRVRNSGLRHVRLAAAPPARGRRDVLDQRHRRGRPDRADRR